MTPKESDASFKTADFGPKRNHSLIVGGLSVYSKACRAV